MKMSTINIDENKLNYYCIIFRFTLKINNNQCRIDNQDYIFMSKQCMQFEIEIDYKN